MRILKIFAFSLLGLFIAGAGFFIYGSFIHNQYFSSVAKIESEIKKGDFCRDVYAKLERYRKKEPSKVSIYQSPPFGKNKRNIKRFILLTDHSTPFDKILFTVFCGKNDKVLDTKLVGD